jgi:cation transport regulator
MPYKQITQLPDNVTNNLPKHAQEIYKEAFNYRVAWSAVEQKYEKNDKGNWVQKDS